MIFGSAELILIFFGLLPSLSGYGRAFLLYFLGI